MSAASGADVKGDGAAELGTLATELACRRFSARLIASSGRPPCLDAGGQRSGPEGPGPAGSAGMDGRFLACPEPISVRFPAAAEHIRSARRVLAALLSGSVLADDALSCLNELTTNALVHSNSRLPGGTFTVRAWLTPGRLRIEVEDNGGPWAPGHIGDPDTCGRGLNIVASLAKNWGITPITGTATARVAWFELELP